MGVSTDAILAYGYDLTEEHYPEDEYTDDFPEMVRNKLREHGIENVGLVYHCSYEYPRYLLATREVTAGRGFVQDVTQTVADTNLTLDRARLMEALKALDIAPRQKEPGWLLVSFWG